MQQYTQPNANTRHEDADITPEMTQIEALLASEMNILSVQERNGALADVHCVGIELQETPEMVQKSLSDFDQAVRSQQNDPMYAIAVNQNRAYVEDPSFRLKFLRANFHDVDKSVRQMMNFLHCKATHFGQDKIAQEIGLSDLTEEDIEVISSGLYHIQEGRDRMGRVIVHCFADKLIGGHKIDAKIRSAYYFWWHLVIPLLEVQTKGIARIYNDVALVGENFTMPSNEFFLEVTRFFHSMPIRVSVTHYCRYTTTGNLSLYDNVMSLLLSKGSQYSRVRSRVHRGSAMEIRYQLRSHGIPTDDTFPLDVDGNVREDTLNLWLEKHLRETNQTVQFRRSAQVAMLDSPKDMNNTDVNHCHQLSTGDNSDASRGALLERSQISEEASASSEHGASTESSTAESGTVQGGRIQPTNLDVLFGKGYRMQSHPGNIRFREYLERQRDAFENTPRAERREIVIWLARTLRLAGVRFLQKTESNEWIESDIAEAEKKVAQYLRELRKKDQRRDAESRSER